FAAANLFIPRASLEAVGGFDEGFARAAGEDTELNLRLEDWGSTFAFSDRALVHHDVIPSGVWRAVRDKRRWSDLARVVKAHPRARSELLTWRVFWKRDHAFLLLLLAGLATRRPAWALALAAPWVHARTCHVGTETKLEAAAVLPGELIVGLAEIAAMLEGSVRNRTLVL
ncbi:MAG: hypothetical protein JF597_00980, partial [Streptomyces sp.]|uniref:glycosyltransferase family 2 protein n=1 Tax=Streptomyces sp. TaxID=1931 RepID=UPI002600E7BE